MLSNQKKIPKLKGKPKYTDAPRYPLIYDYEGEFKRNYGKSVKIMTVELATKITKMFKDER